MRGDAANANASTAAPGAAAELLTQYLGHLTNERRLSPYTTLNYGRDIATLLELSADIALDQLQIHHIRRFVAQLHARGRDGRSLARLLSAWRGFYRYLARDRGYTNNPCAGLRAPKAKKSLPQLLSPDQAARLMEIPSDDTLAIRDKAIFELFYSSGLRLSELTNLAPADINFADATVRVTGKGNKARIVPVGSHALRAVKNWLKERDLSIKSDGNGALFWNRRGTRLGPRAIQHRMERWALKLGLNTGLHPHMLRHSFASHVLQSSGDLRAVQEMLGHASISSTQVYTHLDFQYLAKAYDAAHPRAKRKS